MKVRMHSGCIGQELVAIGLSEPPAPKCQCKKMIEYDEANALVKERAARWIAIERIRESVAVNCPFCCSMTPQEKKTCDLCKGSEKVLEFREQDFRYSSDIVLVSSIGVQRKELERILPAATKPIDLKTEKYRMDMRMRTPRVPTIEKPHIHRAYAGNEPLRETEASATAFYKKAFDRSEKYRIAPSNPPRITPISVSDVEKSMDGDFSAFERIEEYGVDILLFRVKIGIKPEPVNGRLTQQGRDFDMGVPIISQIGGDDEPGLDQEELVMDRAPVASSKDPAATDTYSDRNQALLAYSLKKIEEGDYQECGDRIVAAGISWSRNDPAIWTEAV